MNWQFALEALKLGGSIRRTAWKENSKIRASKNKFIELYGHPNLPTKNWSPYLEDFSANDWEIIEKLQVQDLDFFSGFFAALVQRGTKHLYVRGVGFDKVLEDIFEDVLKTNPIPYLDFRFRIRCHKLYGDSDTVRNCLLSLHKTGFLTIENHDYSSFTLLFDKIDHERAEHIVSKTLGGKMFYNKIADTFVTKYFNREF